MAEYIELSQATTLFGDVDARFDIVEGKIPSNASSGNKMVTVSDIATKADLVDGKVPAAQLPSFVDDVLEYASTSAFPAAGESGKIYVALDTNKTYRWGGSDYVEISESLALGETSSTAYAGDKGKANADAISDIQDLIPSGASTSNKLATASDIPDTSGLQPKNLSTTIGSYTTVEGALSGINDAKVDKVTGKGLSTNDYDATAKGIVDGIPLTIQQLQGSLLTKVDKVQGKGLSTNDYSDNDKTALQTTIPLEISQLQGSLLNKVDKEVGKGLSTNDYDATAKGKVDGMDASIAASQNGSTALLKDTVGWTGKNLGEYVNKALSGNTENGFSFDNAGSGSSIVAPIENNKNYIFSKKDGVGNRFRVILFYNDPRTLTQPDTTANQLIIEQTSSHAPFEFNSDNYNYAACTFATSSAFATQDEAEAMVRLANITDSTYETSHDSVEKILKSVDAIEGKNKLYVPSNIVSVAQNTGITFTVYRNADGELLKVRANGTNTSSGGAFFDVAWNGKENIQVVPNGNYRLSGCPEGGSSNTYEVRVQQKPDNSWLVSDYGDGNGVEFTITNNTRIGVYIVIKAGQTVTDLDFFPMITDSSITDTTFEPHYFTIKDGKANDMCKVGEHNTELIVSAITPSNGKTPEFFIPWNNPDKKVASTKDFKIFDRNGGSWNELAQESSPTIMSTRENGFYLNANLTNALTANTNYAFKIKGILVF